MDHSSKFVTLITGASSGIGAQLARLIALEHQHCALVLIARREKKLHALAQELRTLGADVLVITLDVCDKAACFNAVEKSIAHFGHIDRFIGNAGYSDAVFARDFSFDRFQDVMQCNLNGVLHFFPPLLTHFQNRKSGHLVAISSLAAFLTVPGSSAYHCSKAALMGVMHSLRRDLKNTPIHCTVICPGFIKSALTAKNRFPMPFLMDLRPACKKILKKINQKKAFYAFPKPLYYLTKLLSFLPLWLQDLCLNQNYSKA